MAPFFPSKLSLLLKVLEGETDQRLTLGLLPFSDRALPNLADNIKCGNSLIGPDYFTGKLIVDPEEMKSVNPFDWKQRFPDAMNAGGFDSIIGNPPYLNVDDTWGKGDSRLEALKTLFPHIYNDKTDILFYFLAKSVQLSKGSVGFIVSRAFLEASVMPVLRISWRWVWPCGEPGACESNPPWYSDGRAQWPGSPPGRLR